MPGPGFYPANNGRSSRNLSRRNSFWMERFSFRWKERMEFTKFKFTKLTATIETYHCQLPKRGTSDDLWTWKRRCSHIDLKGRLFPWGKSLANYSRYRQSWFLWVWRKQKSSSTLNLDEILVLGAVLVCYFIMTPFTRGFFCADTTIRYPYKTDTVPTYVAIILSIGTPLCFVMKKINFLFKKNKWSHWF